MASFDITVGKPATKDADSVDLDLGETLYTAFRATFEKTADDNRIPGSAMQSGALAYVAYIVLDSEQNMRIAFRTVSGDNPDQLSATVRGNTVMQLTSGNTRVSWTPFGASSNYNEARGEHVSTTSEFFTLFAELEDNSPLEIRFDSETFVTVSEDNPAVVSDLEVYRNHLFLATEGSVIHSALGNPHNFDPIGGASEIGVGQTITGLLAGYRDTLFIFSVNQTATLKGTSASDWFYAVFHAEAGAEHDTIQLLEEPTALDDRGILNLSAVDAFGDFALGRVSDIVLQMLRELQQTGAVPIASLRVREKNQYRVFFSEGTCLVMSLIPNIRQGGYYRNFSVTQFDQIARDADGSITSINRSVVRETVSGKTEGGRERMFVSFDDSRGFVYELDSGRSFDGNAINALIQLGFNDLGHPAFDKRFRKVQVECDAEDASQLRIACDFDDGDAASSRDSSPLTFGATPGSLFTREEWTSFTRDGRSGLTEASIAGRGRNIAPIIYSSGDDIAPHIVSGMSILFTPARMRR